MIIEKITSEGIAHYSYYIGSGLEAAVIDPRRDVDAYIQLSKISRFKTGFHLR
ncbi:MAG: hypothetical protein QW739_03420 [Candidatus Odinarchaeota archaeon]